MWSQLGAGPGANPSAIWALLQDSNNGIFYAGGQNDADSAVWAWNGATWSTIGSGIDAAIASALQPQAHPVSTCVVTAVDPAVDGAGILGFSVHGTTSLNGERVVILLVIAVDPERESKGVGRRLVEHFFFELAAPLVQRRELDAVVLTHCTARMARLLVKMGIAHLIEPRQADWEDIPSAYIKHAPRIPWKTHFTASWRAQEARAVAIGHEIAANTESVVVFDAMAASRLAGTMRAYGLPLSAFTGIGGRPLYGWARDVQSRGSCLLFK